MILDSSAVLAILLKEAGFEDLISKISETKFLGIGSPTLAESAIILSARLNRDSRPILSRFIQQSSAVIVPFDEEHYNLAVNAWLRFGKGRHKAGLNFDDCMSYATAKLADQPLLCTGDDFSKTDLILA